MSYQWNYSDRCSECGGPLGKKRCKGMCARCYAANRRETVPELSKENRRSKSPKLDWDSDEYIGLKPTETDWARLAAYIDGEGCIQLSPRQTPNMKSLTLCGKVAVTNTDGRLALWCLETFGMKFYKKGHNWAGSRAIERNWKDCYFSQAIGYRAAWVCHNCLPWFLLKREQAETLLEHQATTRVGVWERGSGVTTPQELLDYRMSLKSKMHDLNKRGPESEFTAIVESNSTIN